MLLQVDVAESALESAQLVVNLIEPMPDRHRIFMPAAELLLGRTLIANEREMMMAWATEHGLSLA